MVIRGRVLRGGPAGPAHIFVSTAVYTSYKSAIVRKHGPAAGDERDRLARSLPEHPIEDIDHNDSLVFAFGALATGILGLADSGIINNRNDGNGG